MFSVSTHTNNPGLQGGLEKKDITALLTRAAELAEAAGQRPADRHTDAAYVITAALQASRGLVTVVDFLPVRGGGRRGGAAAGLLAGLAPQCRGRCCWCACEAPARRRQALSPGRASRAS